MLGSSYQYTELVVADPCVSFARLYPSGDAAFTNLTGTMTAQVYDGQGSYAHEFSMNFGSPAHSVSSGNADARGHGNFEYSVPSGYFALCSKNLAEFG